MSEHNKEVTAEDFWAKYSQSNGLNERIITEANFKQAIREASSQFSPAQEVEKPDFDIKKHMAVTLTLVQQQRDALLKRVESLEAENKELRKKEGTARRVCYCGSLRFIDKFKEVEYLSVINGEIALLPCCMFVDIEREYGAESDYKQKADDLHKRKIDICDEVFVLNVGGYVGQSTRSEIDYALSIGKPVKYLEPLPSKPEN